MTRSLICLTLILVPFFTNVAMSKPASRQAWMVRKLGGKLHVKTMIA
jgi:hypothetical protein